jgi:CBS domain-containing protein
MSTRPKNLGLPVMEHKRLVGITTESDIFRWVFPATGAS